MISILTIKKLHNNHSTQITVTPVWWPTMSAEFQYAGYLFF